MAKRPVPLYDFAAFGQAIKAARTERKESRKAVSDANAGSFRAAAPSPAPAPATPVSDAGDGFMNIPDGIDEELPFN